MLEVSGGIIKKVEKGVNVKTMHVEGTKKVVTTQGEQWVDNYVPTYTDGLPFGAVIQSVPIPAPIDLLPGDVLVVDGDNGTPLRVEREVKGKDGVMETKEVYTSDLQHTYREEEEDRKERIAARRRKRAEERI